MKGVVTQRTRAAMLDTQSYEGVEATPQAFAVVALTSITAAIGSLDNDGGSGSGYITAAALLGWISSAWLTCPIRTRTLFANGRWPV